MIIRIIKIVRFDSFKFIITYVSVVFFLNIYIFILKHGDHYLIRAFKKMRQFSTGPNPCLRRNMPWQDRAQGTSYRVRRFDSSG